MKFLSYRSEGKRGLAVERAGEFAGLTEDHARWPGDLDEVLGDGAAGLEAAGQTLTAHGRPVDLAAVAVLPPITPRRIVCVGLNYADHAAESNMAVPEAPTLFSRWASSVIGHEQPIRRPKVSTALDYEGELAVIVGRRGRYIDRAAALDHVAGYSIFNDGSIRDYQLRTTQWTIGKNFDGTGPFGPVLVTPDLLPPGAAGLAIETRLNGKVVQRSSTDQLIFDVAALISIISEAITLEPGDVIVTGTPAGVGAARTPQLFMKAGDRCEVEIEGIGVLANPVADE